MASSPADKHREVTNALSTLTVRVDQAREDSALLRKQLEVEQALGRARDEVVVRLQSEVSALRQRSDDQTRQHEAWVGRAWILVTLLIGSALSLASGLIVTLARK